MNEFLSPAELRDLTNCTPREMQRDDPKTRLNPGLRAYQAQRLEAALERQAQEAEWRAAWKAGQPERERIARAAHGAARGAAQAKRTPPWADFDAIRAFYAEARRLTLETGTLHHVDHEVPLRGRRVSGLHVHNNLRVIPGTDNVRKSNRYEP